MSSNVRMMYERPNWVCENIRTAFGSPLSPISRGIVICFSTSSGAWPEKSVITVTCTSVTSGNASTGSDRNAAMPPATNSARSIRMNSGC